MAHILIVGGHDETFRMIEDLPVELSVFQNSESVTARQARRAHRLCVFDYRNQTEALSMARALHESQRIDAVVSFTEHGLMPAAVIKEALGIEGNAREAVRLTRDKIAMREHLAGRDLGAVLTRSCHSSAEVRSFLRAVGGPIVVKPAAGSGSSGVFRVSSLDQVESAFARSRGEYPGPTLVEEFIDGPEYSVESFSTDGTHDIIAVTDVILPFEKQASSTSVSSRDRPQSSALMISMLSHPPRSRRQRWVCRSTVARFLLSRNESLQPPHLVAAAILHQLIRDWSFDSTHPGPDVAGKQRATSDDERRFCHLVNKAE